MCSSREEQGAPTSVSSVRFIDRPLAPVAEVSLPARAREVRREEIGPVQGEIKLCAHSQSGLTPPRSPTLPSLQLLPLSLAAVHVLQ